MIGEQERACKDIIQILFNYNITKFNFRGKESEYKLDVGWD